MEDEVTELHSIPPTPPPELVAVMAVHSRPPISTPPSQLHSPSLMRSPLLPSATPRMRGYLEEIGHLTKLDPQDTWLPITESRNGNAYYSAFHTLTSGIATLPSPTSVWHNYSFDSHIIGNNGIKLAGFHVDTMHLAQLFDSSRTTDEGYSLEALTSDPKIMSQGNSDDDVELISGKMSMKSIFGKKKLKKDGTEGKIITLPPVDILQREERRSWIRYSALDAMNTLKLFNRLKEKLMHVPWFLKGSIQGTMYDFYEKCWRPFGVLLVKMESEGILVDKVHLSKIEKLVVGDKQIVADKFRWWASKYCEDAKYMNVGSNTQIRQLLFDDTSRSTWKTKFTLLVIKLHVAVMEDGRSGLCVHQSRLFDVMIVTYQVNHTVYELLYLGRNEMNFESKLLSKLFKVLNTEKIFEEGKKAPLNADALKVFAGNIPSNHIYRIDNACNDEYVTEEGIMDNHKLSDTGTDYEDCSYGIAFEAFGGGNKGREACEAIAALCETSAIDSLITNFIIPLQIKEAE
ncbi:DNA polymerase I A, chloroplastic-like [Zingiber officinale]|uniref:DNA polymerase I A, chloroplastic-like n=1 Tax=Zingiber officinale TaxID=94328 RepID=UPI001C4BBAB9|nr:DNA polymerase I A, chloroplastic-like [Zingiber officinale]